MAKGLVCEEIKGGGLVCEEIKSTALNKLTSKITTKYYTLAV